MSGKCYVVRVSLMGDSGPPSTLSAILEDENVLKLGVGIQDDDRKMRADFGVAVRGFVDLRHLSMQVRFVDFRVF